MALRNLQPMVLVASILPFTVLGQDHSHGDKSSPYAGLEKRVIKSLSEHDIEELRRGGGWGLALPAELNGWPGPAHLLELKRELDLSVAQVKAIDTMYEAMRQEAISAGARFIAAEAALNDAFASANLEEDVLVDLIANASEARAALRLTHLSRHLSTPELLSEEQIKKYNLLRGYSDDPCSNVPDGHDPNMWRRHNGCE